MDLFDKYIERILSHEGGYVYHPKDPGGETKYGISRRSFPHVDIKHLTREDAKRIYRRYFWNVIDGDKLPPAVAFQALDAAVNHGRGNAIRFLQRAVDVADDGIIGPITLVALEKADPNDLLMKYLAERLLFYTRLSTWPAFGKGWARRIAHNLKYAAEDN